MDTLHIDKSTTRRIYALGARLGMVDRDDHGDALHALVQGLTGKGGVSELTPEEGQLVEMELRRRAAASKGADRAAKPARKYHEAPGRMTAGQQKMVWYLMFELEKYDPAPAGVQLRDRLCGLISHQFKTTAFPADPFRFLTAAQGAALIEGLKALATRAELAYLHSPRYRQGGA